MAQKNSTTNIAVIAIVALMTACSPTFKVANVAVADRNAIPANATIPPNADSKFSSVIEFNDSVDANTLISGLTVEYQFNNVPVEGTFEVLPEGTKVVFFSNQEFEYPFPCGAGGSYSYSVLIRGRSGAIVDEQGRLWPFSGVHAVNAHSFESANSFGPLLDGDEDNEPGGDFEIFKIINC